MDDTEHRMHHLVSLTMGQRIAAGLRDHPEWLELARENLARWSARNHDSPGLLRCYAEWQSLLQRPVEEICDMLTSESDEAQRLRRNSPFAGVLSPEEVWEIKRLARGHEASRT